MIFGSDGGPRPAYFPAATITRDEYTQSETHKRTPRFVQIFSMQDSDATTPPQVLLVVAHREPTTILTTTTRVTKKCRCHPSLPSFSLLSFSFFRSHLWPRANAPWLG
jgi:hypothetical protein